MKIFRSVLSLMLAFMLTVGMLSAAASALDFDFDFDDDYDDAPLLGDADSDGDISILDVTAIQQVLADLSDDPLFNAYAADADEDDNVSILDATAIQRYLAHMTTRHPVGEIMKIRALLAPRRDYVVAVDGTTGIEVVPRPYNLYAYDWRTDDDCIELLDYGLVAGVSAGEATVTVYTTDGSDLSIDITVRVLDDAGAVEKIDDFYDSILPDAYRSVRDYYRSSSDIRAAFDDVDALEPGAWDAYQNIETARETTILTEVADAASSNDHPYADNTSYDALASLCSTAMIADDPKQVAALDAQILSYIQDVIAKIEKTRTADELLALDAQMAAQNNALLLDISTTAYGDDPTDMYYIKSVGVTAPANYAPLVADYTASRALRNHIRDLFVLAGNTAKVGSGYADRLIALYEKLNAAYDVMPDVDIEMDFDEYFEMMMDFYGKTYSAADAKVSFEGIQLSRYLNDVDENVYVVMPSMVAVVSDLMQSDFEDMKLYAEMTLLDTMTPYLSDGIEVFNDFAGYIMPIDEPVTYDELLRSAATEVGAWDLCSILSERYVTDADRAALRALSDDVVAAYREKITAASWLSDRSKKNLLNKLDGMQINLLFPDDMSAYTIPADLRTLREGGNFIDNMLLCGKSDLARRLSLIGQPFNRASSWDDVDPREVNSFYYADGNGVFILFGLYNDLTFDAEKDGVYNLVIMGDTIAHEIGHAFDTTGMTLSPDGEEEDQLLFEDRAVFDRKAATLVQLYDTYLAYEGEDYAMYEMGDSSLDENLADISALEIITHMTDEHDYAALFEGYAMRSTLSSDPVFDMTEDDHAIEKNRVNAPLSMLDEFYRTYNVKQGDAMYVDPAFRVRLWD